ncbi:hypothetical protein ACP70R_043889 [Stipagrostis hirtigluma subsp. patula]
MNWNQKNSMVWDWENLAQIGPKAVENPKSGSPTKPRVVDLGAPGHGSLSSSGATFTSSSELGHGSSKSSMSASIGSPFKEANSFEFNFAAVNRHGMEMGKNAMNGRVEESRTSARLMIAGSHGEPLISLKLGKGTYSENVCGGQDVKSSESSGMTSPSTVVKKIKVSQQNTQSTYCQVEGCKVDLSSAKDYHRKHKVCEAHTKVPMVIVAGLERRFCQQCSRFHGLAEFDQNKRSCRKRLTNHNARRRKPLADTISFGSSRLSTMFYDSRQQTNIFFTQPPFNQARGKGASSWGNLEGAEFTETKLSWMKQKMVGVDELHFSSPQSNYVVAHAVQHHDFDGLMPLKGINTKVLNQGVEASADASKSNGGLVLGRALSLLSSGSWGSSSTVIQQPSSDMHTSATPPLAAIAASNPVMHALDLSPGGFWQDDPPPLDGTPQIQAFAHL